MLSANPCFRHVVTTISMFFFIILLLLTDHQTRVAADQSDDDSFVTHLNFFRAPLMRGRRRVLSCASDANICLDREKNPWGGTTCCFQQFCRDTHRDPNNCGACGRACAYGLVCCDGKCVDVQNDPRNCGSCFEVCPGQSRCSFAMCDYGG